MGILTNRAKTGFVGEFFIYSELIKRDYNCFITLGNAKAVDLILIDNQKKAHFIDVKSSNTLMKNYHKHDSYDISMGHLTRWQISIRPFWESHRNNPNNINANLADFYIFHSLQKSEVNIIVSGEELKEVMHQKIDCYLHNNNFLEVLPKHLCNWEICELCFLKQYNNQWDKLPR